VDITAEVGAQSHEQFTLLEVQRSLDINNTHHIWLLHYLFLGALNTKLMFFAQAWNQHQLQIQDGPNQLPMDMFVFDTIVHGVCGTNIEEHISQEELEVYGVDWEGLQYNSVLQSQEGNNKQYEPGTSWVGWVGPPPNLGGVVLNEPDVQMADERLAALHSMIDWTNGAEKADIAQQWMSGLVAAQTIFGNMF
jgi:hypothetical protein